MSKTYIGSVLILWIGLVLGLGNQKLFNRYKIVEVGGVKSFDDEELITKLNFEFEDEFEILHRDKIEGTAQVLVKPELFSKFEEEIQKNKFSYKVVIEDIEELLRAQKILRVNTEPLKGENTFDRYMDFSEIEAYLLKIQEKFPDKLKLKIIGKSYNGENITMATISDNINNPSGKEKPIIFIEAGMHAREWISVAAGIFTIDQLLNSSNQTEQVEWQIVPVSNPDGYKYSWTDNRLWRKNLRMNNETKHCIGVDLNRNFGFFWGDSGSSRHKCSQIYKGESAFSEPETQALRDAFMDVKHRVKAYISVHSYGQLIMIPPSHSKHVISEECSAWLDLVAEKMSKAISNTTKEKYMYGSPYKLLYPAAGTSMDWAFAFGDSPIAITFELRDKGKTGFLLPERQIFDGVSEFWSAMKTLYEIVGNSNLTDDVNQLQAASPCFQNQNETQGTHLSLDISEIIKILKSDSENSTSSESPPKTSTESNKSDQGVES